ncbi:histidine phosphatase superfamily branch 2 protein [Nitzschia inconspicua]|uniref:Inositol hexakisphosphate and diphosphoinositol-pentakisphosphate kinase n=1 Tax=Nitzschia inconspicua TaxID=303405 RepID=A0A9K3L3X7_9STRA|nr:histidine phosphatase superfamily branch 2 protein [Nitzschia inconspicua]
MSHESGDSATLKDHDVLPLVPEEPPIAEISLVGTAPPSLIMTPNTTMIDPSMTLAEATLDSVPITGGIPKTISTAISETIAPPPPPQPVIAVPPPNRNNAHRRYDTAMSTDSFNVNYSMSHMEVYTPSETPVSTPATGGAVNNRKAFLVPYTISSAESSLSGQQPDSAQSGAGSISTTAPLASQSQSLSSKGQVSHKPPLAKPTLKKKQSTAYAPVIAAAEPPADGENSDRLRLGICAMDKKARSKPMAEILSRLDDTLFHVVFFGDDVILNKPVQEWPRVDVMIAFYSKGYPLQKAKEYVSLRKPFVLNDLDMQEQLKDRRRVYDLLEASGIDVPRHVFCSKDGYVSTGSGDGNRNGDTQVQEFDDHIEINGEIIHKPFVEKPVDADDHNIAIYYPTSAGGGCKKLFRKIGNRSSEFYPDINEVRRDGSYIYEEFVETQGTDVKMYTVGPEYGHAEARKSPTVDGKVQRNSDGKELRFPVILTLGEKEIARRIVLQFKQFVCGFDLLRVQEGHSVVSYVCDVNGFSFVKNSRKYYDDCAQILTEHILAAVKPNKLKTFSTLDPLVKNVDDDTGETSTGFFPIRLQRVARLLRQGDSAPPPSSDAATTGTMSPTRSEHSNGVLSTDDPTTLEEGALPVRQMPQDLISEPASLETSRHNSSEDLTQAALRKSTSARFHQEELRCVIAVIRHGDRTPKQKLKVNMSEPLILEYFHDHCEGNCTKDTKIKAKTPLTEFVTTVKTILANYDKQASSGGKVNKKLYLQLKHMRDVLERWKITGLNRKLQIKPKQFSEDPQTGEKKCSEVQVILKWGGNLTKLGEHQAIRLGQQFRQEMYPDAPGGGILRLHSTFRHDLKIKTSDEGRVMKTAAAFAKGLLELEGEIPPILVSLVHKEKGSMHMLDPSGDKDAKLELDECKEKITANLQQDIDWREMTEEDRVRMVGPPDLTAMRDALAEVGNPRKTLRNIYETMGSLIEQLEEMLGLLGSGDEREGEEGLKGDSDDDIALSGVKLYKGETLLELTERWRFIYKRLYDPDEDTFDLSRIPDVHDNVRFDVLHNPHLGLSSTLEKLYSLAKSMADTVVPQEYGTTFAQKRSVGIKICCPLLEKLRYDLSIARTDNKADMRYMINMDYSADLPINTMGRRIRTRLYFTSESHLHTMLNVLRFASLGPSSTVCSSPVLSPEGMHFINDTKEVCYLTQIVIRLFEDTSQPLDNPRRFRVEILFSAGATATPLHMSESTRDHDTSRLDTDPLVAVGRDGLTCKDVEDFFESVITEGANGDDKSVDTVPETKPEVIANEDENADTIKAGGKSDLAKFAAEVGKGKYRAKKDMKSSAKDIATLNSSESRDANGHVSSGHTLEESIHTTTASKENRDGARPMVWSGSEETLQASNGGNEDRSLEIEDHDPSRTVEEKSSITGDDKPEGDSPPNERSHRTFYLTVAMGTLLLGAGCLVMALTLSGGRNHKRRYTTR